GGTNIFQQQFGTLPSQVSFTVDLTTNVDPGTPDTFQFGFIFNQNAPNPPPPIGTPMANIPTIQNAGADNMVFVTIDSANPTINTANTDPAQLPNVSLTAVITTTPLVTVPEPTSWTLFALGLGGLAGARLRRRN